MLICLNILVFGFDRKGLFSIGDELDKNVIAFGIDMSSSPHIDKKKDI